MTTRPTPDQLRETLFNILGEEVVGCVFVDAYAGSGAVGIEALSRGARRAVFIEKHRQAIHALEENLAVLKIERRAHVIYGSVTSKLSGLNAGIVFLDPPYSEERAYRACFDLLEKEPPPLIVVQHSSRFTLEVAYGQTRRTRTLNKGENALSFYRFAPAS